MQILFPMIKAVVFSKSFLVLMAIAAGVALVRCYCLVLRKLNNRRGL